MSRALVKLSALFFTSALFACGDGPGTANDSTGLAARAMSLAASGDPCRLQAPAKAGGAYTVFVSADSSLSPRKYGTSTSLGRCDSVTVLRVPPVVVVARPPGAPEPPRAVPAATAPAPTRSVAVAAGADLQQAIDAASCGDELVLKAGAAYRGNFVLPVKPCSGWVSIRSAGQLPPVGTRITPATAAGLAKLLTPNADPALRTAPGAARYRLQGLEVTGAPGVSVVFALLALGDGSTAQRTLAQVPRDLIVDRVYAHGSATLDTRRCLALNSAWTAVVDSYLAECHQPGFDSQAIFGSNGPGPFLILNNYLDGGSENIMFGGDDARAPTLSPADITIRGNYVTRPPSAQGRYGAKNLFELKDARRVVAEGNVFETNWAEAQSGFAILFKSVNQGGDAPWATTSDVAFVRNVVRGTVHGFSVAGHPEAQPVDSATRRVLIAGNLLEMSADRWLQLGDSAAFVAVEHNSVQSPGARIILTCCQQPGFRLVANALSAASWGIMSDDGKGDLTIARHATGAVVTGNALPGAIACAAPPAAPVNGCSVPSTNGPPAADAGADTVALTAMADSVRRGVRRVP